MNHHNIPPNPFTDPKNLAKRSIFDRAGEKVKSLVDAAFDAAIEAVEKQKKKKKILPTLELQEIWDDIEDKIETGEIQEIDLTIGGKSKDQLEKELHAKSISIHQYAREMMCNIDFKISINPKQLNLVKLSVKDLGFPKDATYKEICDKANKLGLDLCPAEVGPHLGLQDEMKVLTVGCCIAMMPIANHRDDLDIFNLHSDIKNGVVVALWLSARDGWPSSRYIPDSKFVFIKRD